jgi:single-stranded-DNA-specific exonuclease
MLRFVPRDARPFDAAAQRALRPYAGPLAALLYARGADTAAAADAFLHPSLDALHDPLLLHDMQTALDILQTARDGGHKTLVYGDYDVDGVCAAALLTQALRAYGIDATAHVPLRAEGYGLNVAAVERFAGEYRLLVTVDLGITNALEVARAQELGMRVIVTDHHQLGLVPCPADAVVNPLLSGYPFPKLCGTGVAYKLACALLGTDVASQWLDLAALATVADIVPLAGENRALVAAGLPRMTARPGLAALVAAAGCKTPLTAEALAYQIAPRLNAAGRIADANAGVRLLLTQNADEAEVLAMQLDRANAQRKRVEADTTAEAALQAEGHDFVNRRVLFVRGQGWHTGVIGLVAGKLNQRYGVPVCALSEENGVLHGSLRGVRGVNLARCLQTCDDLLTRYGGHEMAAGVTLPAENDEAFRERLERAVRLSAAPECFVPAQEFDLPLSLAEADDALVDALALMEPFGFGNPAPVFYTEGARLMRRRAVGAQGAHLQLTLMQDGRMIDGVGFGMGREAARLPDGVDAAFTLARETFMGKTAVKCQVQAIRPSPAAQAQAMAAAADGPYALPLLRALMAELAAAPAPSAGNAAPDTELLHVMPCGAPAGGEAVAQAGGLTVAPAQSDAPLAPAPDAQASADPVAQAPVALAAEASTDPAVPALDVQVAPADPAVPTPDAQAPADSAALLPDAETLLAGRQGTLLVAYARETAARCLAQYGHLLDVADGAPADPRCFHTLVLNPDHAALRGPWRTVVLLDGPLTPAGEALFASCLPTATVVALPRSPALRAMAVAIDAGDEAYRALYKALRGGVYGSLAAAARAAGLTEAQTLLGLAAFHSLGLMTFTEAPFHYTLLALRKCSLADSPLLGALRALIA